MLLEMKAGLGDYLMDPDYNRNVQNFTNVDAYINLIKNEPLLFEPGTSQQYSNSGYAVLGGVIEKATGKSYADNLKERIFEPLGMKDSYFKQISDKLNNASVATLIGFNGDKSEMRMLTSPSPAGGIYTTVEDLLKLDTYLKSSKLMDNGVRAGGTPGWNSVFAQYKSGYTLIVFSNFGRVAEQVESGFRQIMKNENYSEPEMPVKMKMYAILKNDGIEGLEKNLKSLIEKNNDEYNDNHLNMFGYELMQANELDMAIEVFKLNVKLFPDIANTYDSLAEAYMNKGLNAVIVLADADDNQREIPMSDYYVSYKKTARNGDEYMKGESQFIDDLNVPTGTLYATVYGSPIAHGKILSLDLSEAKAIKGVKDIITYLDIPGENQIGGIIQDEELLAGHEVHFMQMPVAIVVAESEFIAREASRKIKIEIEPYEVIIDPREAFAKNKLIAPPRVFEGGNVEAAWEQCDVIIEGDCDSGGQEHLYLETQGAFAYPVEGGSIRIVSSTQGPTAVQRVAAKVLGIPMNKIEVEVLRLGGGFGGKEDQASPWAGMAALAAFKLNKPVKLILPRHDDMRMTGKRHPYSSDYKLGLKADGTMLAYEATFYQNAGASADLSPAVLDRTLFHAANAYHIPNVKVTGISCKTNLPSNTAFRGFGGPQGKFVIEAAIFKAAEVMGITAEIRLRIKNTSS
ncbi:unnamed protein product [Rotaria sp. Silwood1]|nr:unnamed protein product [Rotaria sp. Silwood1]CAF4578352.1 unnamed protein product [Rotaria sp. Silwood1]